MFLWCNEDGFIFLPVFGVLFFVPEVINFGVKVDVIIFHSNEMYFDGSISNA